MEVPMLDEVEFALVEEARSNGRAVVERERRRRGLRKEPRTTPGQVSRANLMAMLEMYRLMTGFEERVPGAVAHHRITLYGPPCPNCSKPLRTPRARYCVACGLGMEDLAIDHRPLEQRRPELFG